MDPFRQRIENLLRQGKISPEEANKLIRALEPAGETTSEALTGSAPVPPPPPKAQPAPPPPPPVVVTPVTPVTPPTPPTPPTPKVPKIEVDISTHTKTDANTTSINLENINHLEINANSGDIHITGVPGLNRIEATVKNGRLELDTRGNSNSARLVAHGNIDDPTEIGWLNTVIKTIGRALPVQLEVRVPEHLANLEVKAVAGDIDIINVQGAVQLDISAGDVTIEGATSFMVNAKAGDIKIKTKLENGASHVHALAGDVNVELLPGSSVALKASTTAGDVSAKGFILTQTEKRMVGGNLEGRLGAARATLECRLTAGDLDIIAIGGTSQ